LGDPARVGVDAARVEVVAGPTSPVPRDVTTWPGRIVAHRFAGDHVTVDVALGDRGRPVDASSAADGHASRRAEGAPSRGPHLRATGPVHAMPGTDRAVTVAVPDDAWRTLSVE
jgi:hypothetical protein